MGSLRRRGAFVVACVLAVHAGPASHAAALDGGDPAVANIFLN
ncbi:MAG TPA: hypothetical protein VMS22_16000 [Candidatus Eisenbacteria bacterium]|nr:hypothetical protein [Candidatus Eisenbacteria bacterium]